MISLALDPSAGKRLRHPKAKRRHRENFSRTKSLLAAGGFFGGGRAGVVLVVLKTI